MTLYIKDCDKQQLKTDMAKALENFLSKVSQDNQDQIYNTYVLEVQLKNMVQKLELNLTKTLTKVETLVKEQNVRIR